LVGPGPNINWLYQFSFAIVNVNGVLLLLIHAFVKTNYFVIIDRAVSIVNPDIKRGLVTNHSKSYLCTLYTADK